MARTRKKNSSEMERNFPGIGKEKLETVMVPGTSSVLSKEMKRKIRGTEKQTPKRGKRVTVARRAGPKIDAESTDDPQDISSDNNSSKGEKVVVSSHPFEVNQSLYEAALKGDWSTANRIFNEDSSKMTVPLNHKLETPLHVAAGMGRTEFVTKLMEILKDEELELPTEDGRTALHCAANSGSLATIMALVEKKSKLTQANDKFRRTPIMAAVSRVRQKDVLRYLTLKSIDEPPHYPFVCTDTKIAGNFISVLVETGYYDICLSVVRKYPSLATLQNEHKVGCLSRLANTPTAFLSGTKLSFWERCVYHYLIRAEDMELQQEDESPRPLTRDLEGQRLPRPPAAAAAAAPSRFQTLGRIAGAAWEAIEYGTGIKHVREVKYKHRYAKELLKFICEELLKRKSEDINRYILTDRTLSVATEKGNVDLLVILLRYFPFLLHINILRVAVSERQEKVFNLMLEANEMTRELTTHIDDGDEGSGDCLLHTAARLAPYPQLSSVSCPALQMQRELQWFQAVENLVAHRYSTWPNNKYETPRQLFTSQHKDLSKEAEGWMKNTSNSCMVVSTLIATVVFAAAFTVPGGNVDGEGTPLFLKRNAMLFVVSDAVGMFSSVTSILMFLSIATARYAEEDFLCALPKRLILGFASLFMAIASMMVTFGATLYMVLNQRIRWITIPIIGITSIPVGLFIMLQLPLLIFMVRSTYGPSIFQSKKIW